MIQQRAMQAAAPVDYSRGEALFAYAAEHGINMDERNLIAPQFIRKHEHEEALNADIDE